MQEIAASWPQISPRPDVGNRPGERCEVPRRYIGVGTIDPNERYAALFERPEEPECLEPREQIA